MKHFFLSILLNCLYYFVSAQTGQYHYFNKNWKLVPKDSADYYSEFTTSNGLFQRKDFVAVSGKARMDGLFSDKEMKTRHGLSTWYYDSGALRDSVVYDNGKRIRGSYFYENGARKAVFTILDTKVLEQKGWDENGKEIADYILDRPAEFPGGKDGWRKYLERNLNANTAADAKAPDGNYTVKLSFIVDEKGAISNVNTTSFPPACAACAVEAIRVIQKGPNWVPAIQFGKSVIYKATQSVTFQVSTTR